MVTTRSQQHGAAPSAQTDNISNTVGSRVSKRKRQSDGAVTNTNASPPKKPRTTQGRRASDALRNPSSPTSEQIDVGKEAQAESGTIQPIASEEPEESHRMTSDTKIPASNFQQLRKRTHSDREPNASNQPASSPAKPKHVRFGSEDPVEPVALPTEGISANGVLDEVAVAGLANGTEEGSEGDDDAPESIAIAKAEADALQASAEASRAAQGLARLTKEKRRKRNDALQAQAQAGTKRQKRVQQPATAPEPSEDPTEALARALLAKGELPDMLPDEILAVEPRLMPPASEKPSSNLAAVSDARKKRFDVVPERKPKDLMRGSHRVRVLAPQTAILPPRSSKDSMHLREQWLHGSRGRNQAVALHRRKMHKSFY